MTTTGTFDERDHRLDKSVSVNSHRTEQSECRACGRNFLARLADLRRGHGRFCSFACRNRARQRKTPLAPVLGPKLARPCPGRETNRGEMVGGCPAAAV